MKNISGFTFTTIALAWILCATLSCRNNTNVKKEVVNPVKSIIAEKILAKPPATYTDTLIINFPAAVFFKPDSMQLIKIKAQTDPMIFDGSMHAWFYQMRNARIVIKKTWPLLAITASEKYRYLLFIKNDDTREYIDLDTINDSHGIFVFNGTGSPIMIDMTNIETAISFYLEK